MRTLPLWTLPLALLLAAPAHAEPRALIIHEYGDNWEWSCDKQSAILTEVVKRKIPFDHINAKEIGSRDLSPYNMIFLSSCQSDTVYEQWNKYRDRYADWVALGGFLAIHGAWDCMAKGPPLPPGKEPKITKSYVSKGKVDESHPLMKGVGQPAEGNLLAHESYAATGDPNDIPLIVDEETQFVAYFVRPHGAGTITYGGLTFECYAPCGSCGFGDAGQVLLNEIELGSQACDLDGDGVGDPPCCLDDDGDGVCNEDDLCPGYDDRVDDDRDGVPDACDPLRVDSDGDGVPDPIDPDSAYDGADGHATADGPSSYGFGCHSGAPAAPAGLAATLALALAALGRRRR